MNTGRRLCVIGISLSVLCGGLVSEAAMAISEDGKGNIVYTSTGWDPNDKSGESIPDVRTTTRRVMRMSDHKVLVIRVRTYNKLGFWWRMQVGLDSRFGPRADFQLFMINADMDGGLRCEVVRKARHRADLPKGRIVQRGHVARCRIRLATIHPDKQVRWRIRSAYLSRLHHPDRAPYEGWYS